IVCGSMHVNVPPAWISAPPNGNGTSTESPRGGAQVAAAVNGPGIWPAASSAKYVDPYEKYGTPFAGGWVSGRPVRSATPTTLATPIRTAPRGLIESIESSNAL